MSYLYGDSTPSELQINFIEFLRDAVDFCVQVLLADQRLVQARARTRTLEQTTAAEIERLESLTVLVGKAVGGVLAGEVDSATARCAAAIVRAADDLVRGEAATVRSALAGEVAKLDGEAMQERDGCMTALGRLLVKHDPPGMTLTLHLSVVDSARYGCRALMTTGFGLDAAIELDIPAGHLFAEVVRVDRLMERLEVQVPEIGGWVHKEVKLRTQHLEKHHIAEFSSGAGGGTIKLRAAADGSGAGFDVTLGGEAPRVRMARVDEHGLLAPPFDLREADAANLLALHDRLAAAADELTRHRRAVAEATVDGEPLRSYDRPAQLVERLIAIIAPLVQEIAFRSHSPGELVLRRLLGEDRREEIFVSKADLKRKLEPLAESGRALFDPLWAKGGSAGGGESPVPGGRPRAPSVQPLRSGHATPPIGLPLAGPSSPAWAPTRPTPAQPTAASAAAPAAEPSRSSPPRSTPQPAEPAAQTAGPDPAPPSADSPRPRPLLPRGSGTLDARPTTPAQQARPAAPPVADPSSRDVAHKL